MSLLQFYNINLKFNFYSCAQRGTIYFVVILFLMSETAPPLWLSRVCAPTMQNPGEAGFM